MGKRLDYWKRLFLEILRKNSDKRKNEKQEKDSADIKDHAMEEKAGDGEKKAAEEKKEKKEAEKEAEKEEKAEKETDEKETEKEEKARKEADEKEAEKEEKAEKEADEKEAEKEEKAEKEADEKEEEAEKEAGEKTAGKKESKKNPKAAAMEAEQEQAGDVLKHMLEYEQVNEKPENRVIHDLINYGQTDELVKIVSAADQFQAAHKNTNAGAADKDQKQLGTNAGTPQPSQAAAVLTNALELARENEKETKILEEQKERIGYQELLAMEASSHHSKAAAKRVVRRPVQELKLQADASQQKPMEPPTMGAMRPLRRKKKEEDE